MNNLKWFIQDLIYKIQDLFKVRYETPHKRLYDNGKREETFTNSIFCDLLYIWFCTCFIFEIILYTAGVYGEAIIESVPILKLFYDTEDDGFMFWPIVILGGESIFRFFWVGTPYNTISRVSGGVILLISCILNIPLICWLIL